MQKEKVFLLTTNFFTSSEEITDILHFIKVNKTVPFNLQNNLNNKKSPSMQNILGIKKNEPMYVLYAYTSLAI